MIPINKKHSNMTNNHPLIVLPSPTSSTPSIPSSPSSPKTKTTKSKTKNKTNAAMLKKRTMPIELHDDSSSMTSVKISDTASAKTSVSSSKSPKKKKVYRRQQQRRQQQQQQQQSPKSPTKSTKQKDNVVAGIDEITGTTKSPLPSVGVAFVLSPQNSHHAYFYDHCCGIPFVIRVVHNQDMAIIFTSNLRHCGLHFMGGFPEFILFDVPRTKIEDTCHLITFLARQMERHLFVKGGDIVESDGLILEAGWIVDLPTRVKLVQRFPFLKGSIETDLKVKWIHLKPHFLPWDYRGMKSPQKHQIIFNRWGTRPAAPAKQTKLRDAIVDAFTSKVLIPKRKIIWYIDGDDTNTCQLNMQGIELWEAFANPSWKVDHSVWDQCLQGDPSMIEYVRKFPRHFLAIFKKWSDSSKLFTPKDEKRIRMRMCYSCPGMKTAVNITDTSSICGHGDGSSDSSGTDTDTTPSCHSSVPVSQFSFMTQSFTNFDSPQPLSSWNSTLEALDVPPFV